MKHIVAAILSAFVFLTSCSPHNSNPPPSNPLDLADCILTSPPGVQFDARCGTWQVPEDRSNPDKRQIELSIAVIPAVTRAPEPDPLFLLAGGPGQAAIETFSAALPYLFNIHQKRDIVLVDQRGTGKSNPLQCLRLEDEWADDEEAIESLQSCPKELDADVRFYHTEIAMKDLDEIRSALGYEKINLYGISYGTRAALTYLRMFPERVRTITLDAVVDPGFVMYQDTAADGQAALEAFFARCETDNACKTSFPNLRNEFDELLARLENTSAEVNIRHPRTNKPLHLTVTHDLIINMTFQTLYSPDLVATLPLSIHTAYADENYAPLISQAFLVNAGVYDGMYYAVTCTEDAPFLPSAEEIPSSANENIFDNRTTDFVKVCEAWQKGEVSPGFREPVVSNVPALLLSGSADPITPPHHAEEVAKYLTNSVHLVFPGMGHGNLFSRCGKKLLEDFIQTASVRELDTSCVENVQPPPFFVNFSGPLP
ncbi:MAG: alpha/beta hydrolase [Chloroflexota bacterium]